MNNINAIKFLSEWTSIISLAKIGETSSVSLEYSYNGNDWSEWDLSGLTVNSGDTLYIRGNNPSGFNSSSSDYYSFVIKGDKVSCSGNIMALIDYRKMIDIIPCDYCFYGLFKDCTVLTTAPELPAMTLAESCYDGMFAGCSSLKAAPELPATKLADGCYYQMFSGCTSLTAAPELPASELADFCYVSMFSGCTSLKTAPKLQTNISNNYKLYYMYMFDGCKFNIVNLIL